MFRSIIRLPEGRQFGTEAGFLGRHNGKRLRHVVPESRVSAASLELLGCAIIWTRALILATVIMGGDSMVVSGTVVSKSVPPNTVFGGVPAKVICSTDTYLEKMQAKSLGCGHLKGAEKVDAIRRIYTEKGWFN
jgi:hypothetical protein